MEKKRYLSSLHLSSVFYVIGLILTFASFSMVLPLITAYIYQETASMQAFAYSFGGTLLSGLLLYFFCKKSFDSKDIRQREACFIVTFSWISVATSAAFPYLLSGSLEGSLFTQITNAYFEAMSGFTTTGASILNNIEAMPKSLLLWRSESQWLGGMGIILLSVAILPFLGVGGMQLFKAEVPGVSVDKITPRISETAKTLWLVYIFLSLTEFLLLILGQMSIYDALCHTFSTLSTGGFSPKNISVEHYNSVYTEMVITVFMLFGGINFILFYKAFTGRIKDILYDLELRLYLGIIIVSLGLISITLYFHNIYDSIWQALRYSLFQIVSILTTTGFSSTNWEKWPVFCQTLLVIMMILGGMAGSTAGGSKLIRILVLVKYAYRELLMIIHPRAVISIKLSNHPISRDVIRGVLAFFVILTFMIVFSTLALTAMGIDFTTAFTAAITACGNVGPGLNLIGPAHNFSFMPEAAKWILVLCMLLGRLEIYTAFVLFLPDFWKK